MPADDTTISRCTAAKEYAEEAGIDPDEEFDWKIGDGVWIKATTNQVKAYGVAIGAHMRACFTRERELSDLSIASPDLATLRAVDISTGWPV